MNEAAAGAFDAKLACECAKAFSLSTQLGCVVSDLAGQALYSQGASCATCNLCALAELPPAQCAQAHIYGMKEAERFGGRYIYFCAMGLTCFVSPILGEMGSSAKITVGPFLMVDEQDFVAYDLVECLKLRPDQIERVRGALSSVPYVEPARVNQLSTLLFMAVGFMNNVSQVNRMRDSERVTVMQGQITSYILQLKAEAPTSYPFSVERELLNSITQSDQSGAARALNELLGHIMFSSGSDISRIKTRVNELLVLVSRAAVELGADPEEALRLNDGYLRQMPAICNVDELCLWLSGTMNEYMRGVFAFLDARQSDAIHRVLQYMQVHCAEKVTLEGAARHVGLSPSYLSRLFKKETGTPFPHFLNQIRVDKGKRLLRYSDMPLSEIAQLTGFEDQSYFTKVFRAHTGMPPSRYRREKSGAKVP